MARISKQRGYSLEYKIVNWFNNEEKRTDWPSGWQAERNTLSKQETSFGVVTAKHDVKARRPLDNGMIFLQIEAKKTGKDLNTIQWKWLEKIDFMNDELMVVAFSRTPEYALITVEAYCKLLKLSDVSSKLSLDYPVERFKGGRCFRLHASSVENVTLNEPYCFYLEKQKLNFVVIPFDAYIKARELLPPNLSKEQMIAMLGQETLKQVGSAAPPVSVPTPSETTYSCPHCHKPIKITLSGE